MMESKSCAYWIPASAEYDGCLRGATCASQLGKRRRTSEASMTKPEGDVTETPVKKKSPARRGSRTRSSCPVATCAIARRHREHFVRRGVPLLDHLNDAARARFSRD